MKDKSWLTLGFMALSMAMSFASFLYGWMAYGWHHDQSRHVYSSIWARTPQNLIHMKLDKSQTPSNAREGDRLDILVESEQETVTVVHDMLVIANNFSDCCCQMTLKDATLLSQAIRNGSKITCRTSIAPGERRVALVPPERRF